jgi:hypothetical protein
MNLETMHKAELLSEIQTYRQTPFVGCSLGSYQEYFG